MKKLLPLIAFTCTSIMAFMPETALYQNTHKTKDYFWIVSKGDGYSVNGIYSTKEDSKTAHLWDAQCKKANDSEIKCIYTHSAGHKHAGTITFIKKDNTTYASIRADSGYSSDTMYEQIIPSS